MKNILIMILLIFFINAMKLKSKMKVKQDEKNLDEEEVPNIVVEKIDVKSSIFFKKRIYGISKESCDYSLFMRRKTMESVK